jgi:hypothetical protein
MFLKERDKYQGLDAKNMMFAGDRESLEMVECAYKEIQLELHKM